MAIIEFRRKPNLLTMGIEICSICGGPIEWVGPEGSKWKSGNNAEPVNSGRCCGPCDRTVVLEARFKQSANSR